MKQIVKHNLKNISLHLQNVHAMSPAQYEQQYGMIPEDEAEIEPMEPLIQPQVDYGFGGGHFLLDDNNVEIDFDALYEPGDDEADVDMKSHGSVLTHLLSQVRIGMDLTKVYTRETYRYRTMCNYI